MTKAENLRVVFLLSFLLTRMFWMAVFVVLSCFALCDQVPCVQRSFNYINMRALPFSSILLMHLMNITCSVYVVLDFFFSWSVFSFCECFSTCLQVLKCRLFQNIFLTVKFDNVAWYSVLKNKHYKQSDMLLYVWSFFTWTVTGNHNPHSDLLMLPAGQTPLGKIGKFFTKFCHSGLIVRQFS